jgi:predicted DNA-binding transcriptional regulator
LKIEHFSDYSKQAILQDFEATIFVSNVQTLIVKELNEELEHKNRKYRYKVNNAISYGLLKNKVVSIFFNSDPENLIKDLKAAFKKHLEPIKPNRSFPRKTMKFKKRRKPIVPKNQKDTFLKLIKLMTLHKR